MAIEFYYLIIHLLLGEITVSLLNFYDFVSPVNSENIEGS
jgi:hypothetical protein